LDLFPLQLGWSDSRGACVHGSARDTFLAGEKVRQHLTLASHWRQFWRDLPCVRGTAEQYLAARECASPPEDGHLRSTEALRHPSGYMGPALVALVTDALTREPLTLHRTWIRADGRKADVDPPRLLLGKHRKAGGVIRLWPDDAITAGLAIAEGIETALTVAHAYTPVWSTIDAGNMAAFPVLDGITELLIVADNDPAGLRAATQCAERWYRAGRRVRIAKSPIPGEDLNDLARRAG
jgi:putative DNA primase/helicase